MTMRLFRCFLILSLITAGLPSTAHAQVYATTTTISAAMTATQQTMVVSSATGFVAGRYVYIDAEAVQIGASYSSGTTIPILRGQLGTASAAHASSERVVTGVNNHFQNSDPGYGAACTVGQGQAVYLPWINVLRGLIWMCTTSVWKATSTAAITYNSIPTTFP
jgi:hypothetical protein